LEQKAYRDTWGRGVDSYLQWFYETSILFRDLMHDEGSAYIHVGEKVSFAVRAILDEVLGPEQFVNEIIWRRSDAHADASAFGRIHDTIFLYSKSKAKVWNQQYVPYTEKYIEDQYRYVDEKGQRFLSRSLSASGLQGGGYTYEWKGVKRSWRCPQSTMERYEAEGRLTYTGKGLVRYKQYLDEMPGLPVQSIWDAFPKIHHLAHERVAYPTQKPAALLERIVETSSNENDLVLDCFCGSGTTAAVAEKLNRRWIACDLGRFAIHTTRKRLLGINGVKPFVLQNLGKYERQAWQVAEFAPSPSTVILSEVSASQSEARTESKDPMSAGNQQRPGKEFSETRSGHGENSSMGRRSSQAGKGSFDSRNRFASESISSAQDDKLRDQREREANYRKFILELYHATPVSGHVWLHGAKGGRMVHIGAVDAPVTRADVNAIAAEVWKSAGKGPNSPQKPAVDILGWEFALELNETAKEVAAQARVDAAFKKIPREGRSQRFGHVKTCWRNMRRMCPTCVCRQRTASLATAQRWLRAAARQKSWRWRLRGSISTRAARKRK
jgi:DNA modification methylase